jgi:DNA-binding NarL/FixJ family response regulator
MVTTPTILSDIIKLLAVGRVELDVVAEFSARHAVARRLTSIQPDLVVIGLRRGEPDAVIRRLIKLVPGTKFIAFSGDGQTASGFELRLYQTDLSDTSVDAFVEFIHSRTGDFKG